MDKSSLERDDIESQGFIYQDDLPKELKSFGNQIFNKDHKTKSFEERRGVLEYYWLYKNYWWYMLEYRGNGFMWIRKKYVKKYTNPGNEIFVGRVSNKEEFDRVLEQLGITKNLWI